MNMMKGIQDKANMVKTANDMRKQQAKFQKLLAEISVTGTSKNGKVTVIVGGDQKIQNIKIDPELIKFVYENFTSQGQEDNIMSKSIVEAVDDAISKVQTEVVKKIQESGNIGDLMGMLKGASNMMGS